MRCGMKLLIQPVALSMIQRAHIYGRYRVPQTHYIDIIWAPRPKLPKILTVFQQANSKENIKLCITGPLWTGITRWLGDYLYKRSIMQKAFSWHDTIMPCAQPWDGQTSIQGQRRFENWLYIHRNTELGQDTTFALGTAEISPWDTQMCTEKFELYWIEESLLQHDPCGV